MDTIWNKNNEEINQWSKACNFNDHDEFREWIVVIENKYAFSKWSQSFIERYSNSTCNLHDMLKYLFLKLEVARNNKRVALSEQAILYKTWMKSTFRKKYYEKLHQKKTLDVEHAIHKEKFYDDCIFIVNKMLKEKQGK